jgi:hypothetical protein
MEWWGDELDRVEQPEAVLFLYQFGMTESNG